jgi:hypothetical protein
MVLGRNQPGEDVDSAGANGVVVVSTAIENPAHLHHTQLAPLRPIVERQLLQQQHAMRQAPQLEIAILTGTVVQQKNGRAAVGEEVLEPEDLSAVPQRVPRQKPKLRQRVEHHAHRIHPLDGFEDRLGGAGQLDFRGMKHRVLGVGLERFFIRHQLEDLDPIERPAMRGCHQPELLGALRQGHIQPPLTPPHPLYEKLQRQGGLAGAGIPLHEEHMIGGIAPTHDTVESGDSRKAGLRMRALG